MSKSGCGCGCLGKEAKDKKETGKDQPSQKEKK